MSRQFEMDFEPGLLERYPEFMDCVRASVHGCGRALKAIAADLDMSASELSRRLSEQGDIGFLLKKLPDLIRATNSRMPIHWLIEAFCEDPKDQERRAMAELAALLPKLNKLVSAKR